MKAIAADTPDESALHLENKVIPETVISFAAMFSSLLTKPQFGK